MPEQATIPILTAEQIRVLGVLIEKSKATPEYYPMTINAITTACNQKTSRKPVVNYDEDTVVSTLNSLKIVGLVSTVTGGTSRSLKYKHNLAIAYPLIPAETTILCLLFLRGALTPGEINTNSGRLFEFETLEEINQYLEKLGNEGYVKQLDKQPGQKEQRYVHLFTDEIETNDGQSLNLKEKQSLEERIESLETELHNLKEKFEEFVKELTG